MSNKSVFSNIDKILQNLLTAVPSNDFENKKLIYWLEGEVFTPFFFPDDRLSRPQIVFNKETGSFYETSANI